MLAETLTERPEEIGTDSEIENADALRRLGEELFEIAPTILAARIGRNIIEPVEKAIADFRLLQFLRHVIGDRLFAKGAEFDARQGPARDADDPRTGRDLTLLVAVKEGGQ